MDVTKLEADALSLPHQERAALAHKLLLSLEEIGEDEFDRIWGEEAARRASEIDAGEVQAVPGDEVGRKARLCFGDSFHPEAETEYLEAIRFFEGQKAGLGAGLIHEFERFVSLAVERPNAWKLVHASGVRRIGLRRFPFAIFFRQSQDGTVVIQAFAHHRRRPGYWIRRVGI